MVPMLRDRVPWPRGRVSSLKDFLSRNFEKPSEKGFPRPEKEFPFERKFGKLFRKVPQNQKKGSQTQRWPQGCVYLRARSSALSLALRTLESAALIFCSGVTSRLCDLEAIPMCWPGGGGGGNYKVLGVKLSPLHTKLFI